MRTVHFENCEVSVHGSPWALFLYRREFKKDWYEDYQEATGFIESTGYFDQLFLLQTCWALAKTLDKDLPPFEEWANSLEANMAIEAPWTGEVMSEVLSELFRVPVEEQEETQ